MRTPLAGRTFESFSEDPLLTSRLAVAYVEGVQGGGVGCCIKHFACNDQEHERMTISAEVSEQAPYREVHLVAFEAAVREAGVWAVMTAYNKVNGTYCGEQPDLINGILRDEWGFDGLVMSDWFGTHSTAPARRAGLDLEMPGPPAWFGPTLATAVREGLVDESVVDGQVRHLLRLMGRVGLLDGTAPAGAGADEREDDDPGRRAVAREAAADGTVMLVNDGLLPVSPEISVLAVLGPNASQLAMGGGSSEVTPHRRRSVAQALAERLPHAVVSSEADAASTAACRPRSASLGRRGIPCRLLRRRRRAERRARGDGHGLLGAHHVDRVRRNRSWPRAAPRCGSAGPSSPTCRAAGGSVSRARGHAVLRLRGSVVVDNAEPQRGTGFYGAGSEPVEAEVDLEEGVSYELDVELWPRSVSSPIMGTRIGAARPESGDEFERALCLARTADVAVVVVGSNGQWESEGHDRAGPVAAGAPASSSSRRCSTSTRGPWWS